MKKLITCRLLVLSLIISLTSCRNNSGPLSQNTEVPISKPVLVDSKKKYAVVLDQDKNVWQVNLRYPDKINKIPVEDVHSIGLDINGYALKDNGDLFTWKFDKPDDVTNIKELYDDPEVKKMGIEFKLADKRVKKVIPFGDFPMVIFMDGSVDFLSNALIGFSLESNYLAHVKVSEFEDVKDIYLGGINRQMFIVALTNSGEVYVAGGGRNGKTGTLEIGKNGYVSEPVKIEGLKNIRNIGMIGRSGFLYGIDEKGNIHYWTGGLDSPGVRVFEENANVIYGERLIRKDGEIVKLEISQSPKYELKVSDSKPLGISDAYAFFYYNNLDFLCIEKDGSLSKGSYISYSRKEKAIIRNKITIGDIKVNLDYFKK